MKLVSRIELKVDGYDKCSLLIDHDCPLGQLYDYSCALKSFVMEKMQEAEKVQQTKTEEIKPS